MYLKKEVIREARSVKSKLELQYIETATRICDIGMKAIYDALEPGITELEIVGAYTQAQCKAGGEIQGIPYMVRSGPYRSWSFHIPASRRKIMLGDPVGVDLAGVYNRYHSNQCRYFSVDEPPKEFAELYSVNKKIMDMVKEKIRPDMLVAELLCDLRDFYKEEGLWGKQYWIGGYEMGIAFPPDWCGGFLTYDIYMDCDNTEKRFVPGTVVNFETGFGVIDTLMFKEDEAIVLGNTPRELMIKEF